MPPSFAFPSSIFSSLSSSIASSVSAGVVGGVNSTATSVQQSVARAGQVAQMAFSSAANDARAVIDNALAGASDIATRNRQELVSASRTAVMGVASRLSGLGTEFTNTLSRSITDAASKNRLAFVASIPSNVATRISSSVPFINLPTSGGVGGGRARDPLTGRFISARANTGLFAGLLGNITGGIRTIEQGVIGFFRGVGSLVGQVFDVGRIGGIVRTGAARVWTGLTTLYHLTAQGLATMGTHAVNALRTGITTAANTIRNAFTTGVQIAQAVGAVIVDVGQAMGRVLHEAWDAASTAFMTTLRTSVAAGQGVARSLAAAGNAAMAAASAFLPAVAVIFTVLYYAIGTAVAFAARQLSNGIILAFRVGGLVLNSVILPAFTVLRNVFLAAFRVGSAIYNTVAPILANAIQTVAGWIRTGFAWLRGAFQSVAGWIGNIFRSVLPNLISSIGAFVSRLASFGPALVSFVSRVWAFGAAIFTLISTLSLFAVGVKSVWEATKFAMDRIKTAMQMSATNGLSTSANSSIINRFSVFGINPQTAQNAFSSNAALQNMKGGLFGLPNIESAGFIESFADKFATLSANGMLGQLQAMNMAKVMGLDNPEFLALSKLTRSQRQNQQSYAVRIDNNLGLNPAQIAQQATEVTLSVNKISYAFQQLKLKLFSIVAPLVEKALSGVSSWIGNNAGKISQLLERAVHWLFVDAPVKIADALIVVTNSINDAVIGIIDAGRYLVANIPVWLNTVTMFVGSVLHWLGTAIQNAAVFVANGLLTIGQVAANWAQATLVIGSVVVEGIAVMIENVTGAVANGLEGLSAFIVDFATNVDNGLRTAIRGILSAVDGLVNGLSGLSSVMAGISAATVSAMINAAIVAAGPAGGAFRINLELAGIRTYDPITAYRTESARASAQLPQSNMAANFDAMMTRNRPDMLGFANALNTNAAAIRAGGVNGATFTRTQGMATLNGVSNMLSNIAEAAPNAAQNVYNAGNNAQERLQGWAQFVGPLGERIGNSIAGPLKGATDWMEKNVKPYTGGAANMAQAFKEAVGTEKERGEQWEYLREIRDGIKEQSGIMRQQVRDGVSLSGVMGSATATMIKQVMNKQAREVLDR